MSGVEILIGAAIFATVAGGVVTYVGQQQAAAAQRQQAEMAQQQALQQAEFQRQQNEYQAQVAEYQAAVALNNKTIADRAAADAEARGDVAEAAQRRQAEILKGRQRAVLAGSGVALEDGTPLDILSDTSALGEVDALTVRSNAQREALGFRTQGIDFQNEARLNQLSADNSRISGSNAVEAGRLTAANIAAASRANSQAASLAGVSTIIGTVGSVAKQWYSFQTTPVKK